MSTRPDRHRLRRKDLRGPDEFVTATNQVTVWADAHRTLVVGVGAAVLVLAAAAIGWSRYQASRIEAASRDFQMARAAFEAGKYDEALPEFEALSGAYQGTTFGRLGIMYRGHALVKKGDSAAGAAAYEEFLASGPPADYLKQEVLVALGHTREAAGDAAAALARYTEAAEIEGPFRTEARLGAARLEEAAGREDKARALYVAVAEDLPSGELKDFVTSKLPAATAVATPADAAPADVPD